MTKAAPINAPAEATRVQTRLPSEKGAESAMAALELVADADVPLDVLVDADVPLDALVEAWLDTAPLPVLTATMPNQ